MSLRVSTGDLGLDVLLGGGFQLVEGLPKAPGSNAAPSATLVIRGGAGAGKTLMGLHAALELAEELGGDVAVGCVEILPTEYVEQIRSARPDIQESRLAALPALPSTPGSRRSPRVYCALLTDLDPDAPDLVASLEGLARDVSAAGGKPRVLVVDSLIEGYGIGTSAPRAGADAVMKFAAQAGYGLVLCEETKGADASPWVFAADTVLELGVEARERGRWIEVRKHRFGASISGRHEIELGGGKHPQVFPEPHAWVARGLHGVLAAHGWQRGRKAAQLLTWDSLLQSKAPSPVDEPLKGAFTVITSQVSGVARSLAYGLLPRAGEGTDMVIELDPLVAEESESEDGFLCHLPTVHGPARALRMLVERFAWSFGEVAQGGPKARRVIVGDLELVLAAPDALAWVEAVRVFATLVIGSGWGIPVIAYASGVAGSPTLASTVLSAYADLQISGAQPTTAFGIQRWRRRSSWINWPVDVTSVRLPLDDLPRPGGRRIGR